MAYCHRSQEVVSSHLARVEPEWPIKEKWHRRLYHGATFRDDILSYATEERSTDRRHASPWHRTRPRAAADRGIATRARQNRLATDVSAIGLSYFW